MPFQTAHYDLSLTGADPVVDQAVPEPAALTPIGLVAILLLGRFRSFDD